MPFRDVGWMRPTLALVLYGVGVLLRFAPELRRRDRSHLHADRIAELRRRWRHRTGDMLFAWAGWVVVQMAVNLPESWLSAFWAPLVIVVSLTLLYPARFVVTHASPPSPIRSRPIPRRGGWLVVLLRESLPLAVILATILLVRRQMPDIPDRVPVGWTLDHGPYLWMAREDALALLRHQTMVVYLLLSGLEGLFLIVRWARGHRGDIAGRMLTVPHWEYYAFKLAWIALFAGLNLGFVGAARDDRSPVPYLAPALILFALLATFARRLRAAPEEEREDPA